MKGPTGHRPFCYASLHGLCIAVLALALWPATLSLAQTIAPRKFAGGYQACTWGDRDGLPQNTVLATVGTPDGYLWFATYEGMARFDGGRFVVFDAANTPALQDIPSSILWHPTKQVGFGSGRTAWRVDPHPTVTLRIVLGTRSRAEFTTVT